MGSWMLEVGKMFVYVLFPVATFYVYNQPSIVESWYLRSVYTDNNNKNSPEESEKIRETMEELSRLRLEKMKQNVL